MIPLFESTNIWHISNWRNLFKVPIRPIDTNCNLILWIDFGAYRSLIELCGYMFCLPLPKLAAGDFAKNLHDTIHK